MVAVWLLHSHYQLVWMTDSDVASNIIMTSITSPFLFVLNPQTHEHYLPDELTTHQLTVDAVVDFFDDISNGSRQVCLYCSSPMLYWLRETVYNNWLPAWEALLYPVLELYTGLNFKAWHGPLNFRLDLLYHLYCYARPSKAHWCLGLVDLQF